MKRTRAAERGRVERVKARSFGALLVRALLDRPEVGRFSVLHIELKPGTGAPELYHRKTEEFFLVLRGSAVGRIGGRTRRFRAGDFCFLPAGCLHRFEAGPEGVEILDVFAPRLDLSAPDIVAA